MPYLTGYTRAYLCLFYTGDLPNLEENTIVPFADNAANQVTEDSSVVSMEKL